MGTLIISAAVILAVMGFGNHVLWLAAAALLFLYVRYGRTGGAPGTASSSGGGPSSARPDPSYRAYRDRRDRQAKWERRYRRERPREARRQERQK
ncbi:hypothetical protein AB0D27_37950 [Streptomyces sp. NPDC048415]|jgi:hypothetical protein|uniref:hypothetical protein n=1 Tax=Streptomyces sp. NPDC048415 TaxID=3154822 RepID=UPI00343CC31F